VDGGGGFAGAALFIGEDDAMQVFCAIGLAWSLDSLDPAVRRLRPALATVLIGGIPPVQIIRQLEALRERQMPARELADKPVALVPTMGALHAGHMLWCARRGGMPRIMWSSRSS
jgi:hypothetical protein